MGPAQDPQQMQIHSNKRKLAHNADLYNSAYFKIRSLARELRPHFIQVLQTPDFRNSKAANEIKLREFPHTYISNLMLLCSHTMLCWLALSWISWAFYPWKLVSYKTRANNYKTRADSAGASSCQNQSSEQRKPNLAML
ncbi:hypothetical protein WN943_027996 [Citrus x changshan-huyou]